MRKNLRFVGLDVHKDSISVAVAESGREPARLLDAFGTTGLCGSLGGGRWPARVLTQRRPPALRRKESLPFP
jgi:hypothetical protein